MAASTPSPIDHAVLAAAIASGPLASQLAGQNAAVKNVILNTPADQLSPPQAWTKRQPLVPIASVLIWAATADGSNPAPLGPIVTASNTPADPLYGVCLAADRLLDGGVTALDVSNASVIAMVAGLQAGDKISANQQASLLALGYVPATQVEELFGAGVATSVDDVLRAGG